MQYYFQRGSASGTSRTLAFRSWASALEKILLVDAAKSEFLAFLPKLIGDFSKGDTENRIVGGRERHVAVISPVAKLVVNVFNIFDSVASWLLERLKLP